MNHHHSIMTTSLSHRRLNRVHPTLMIRTMMTRYGTMMRTSMTTDINTINNRMPVVMHDTKMWKDSNNDMVLDTKTMSRMSMKEIQSTYQMKSLKIMIRFNTITRHPMALRSTMKASLTRLHPNTNQTTR